MSSLPPGFTELDPDRLRLRCDEEVTRRRDAMARMEAQSGPGHILEEFNELAVLSGNFDDALAVLQNASPAPVVRDAAQAGLELLMPLMTELFQSTALYERVRAYEPDDQQAESYRLWLLEQFEDSGAALPEQPRQRVKQIQDELISLSLQFQKNVNDEDTRLALDESEVAGLPPGWLAQRERDDQGRVLVSLDYPCFGPFIELAHDAAARRRVWLAFQNRVGPRNLELMDRAVVLRHELAGLYGFADYASFSLRRKMAGTPAAVAGFLQSIKVAVDALEQTELDELRAEKAAATGQSVEGLRVERWDVAYLQQRIRRQRFDIDAEALRANFPTASCVEFVMRVAQGLYGIRFERRDVATWHEDVQYFDVIDTTDSTPGQARGGVYLDLFPRSGKFSHAALFSVRRGSVLAGSLPIKALVCNFNRDGLTPDELETLFHEFGHALHGVLSRARFADQSGTSVRHDFVEVPSLMFEEWARREVSLKEFTHCFPGGPQLGSDQIARLSAARHFGAGLRYARQWLYSTYDLTLHGGPPQPALALWSRLEGETRLGHVQGTMMPASFGHLMGGYEAGYYSYLWSEVLAVDMLSAFQGNLLDPMVGQRYRRLILEPGGSRPPQDLVEEFLGRKPDSKAFFAEIAAAQS